MTINPNDPNDALHQDTQNLDPDLRDPKEAALFSILYAGCTFVTFIFVAVLIGICSLLFGGCSSADPLVNETHVINADTLVTENVSENVQQVQTINVDTTRHHTATADTLARTQQNLRTDSTTTTIEETITTTTAPDGTVTRNEHRTINEQRAVKESDTLTEEQRRKTYEDFLNAYLQEINNRSRDLDYDYDRWVHYTDSVMHQEEHNPVAQRQTFWQRFCDRVSQYFGFAVFLCVLYIIFYCYRTYKKLKR